MEINKNIKGAIIVLIVAIVAYLIYKYAFKSSTQRKLSKGYAKKPNEFVACDITDYDKDFYVGYNSANVQILLKKNDVKKITANNSPCAIATKKMNVYYLNS